MTVNGGYPAHVAAHLVITDSSRQGMTLHSYTLQVANHGPAVVQHQLCAGLAARFSALGIDSDAPPAARER